MFRIPRILSLASGADMGSDIWVRLDLSHQIVVILSVASPTPPRDEPRFGNPERRSVSLWVPPTSSSACVKT